jgi:hypothetical protein
VGFDCDIDDLLVDLTNPSDQLQLELLNDFWAWWLQVGHKCYSIVFKIATDYVVIPLTSCNNKCVFSLASNG